MYLFFIIIIASLLAIAGAGTFYYIVKTRRHKDVERSLKLVTLLVKIPPLEVAQDSTRDFREQVRENASKAEGIFRMLTGIGRKKFSLRGQRYVSFEVVANGKEIFFYIAVPAKLLVPVKKALGASYPGIQIEQKDDENIFSKTAMISGVVGGEFMLAKPSYYPLNTYQMSEQDAFVGIMSSLSNLDDGEGAAIQILIRPASKKWLRKARRASKQLLNSSKKSGSEKILGTATEIIAAPLGSTKDSDSNKNQKQPDSIDQKKSELIEEKSKFPVFESVIRVIASSETPGSAEAVIDSLKLGYAQLNLNNSNKLKFIGAKNTATLATDFIFRYFPSHSNWSHRDILYRKLVFNTVELATIFHLPSKTIPIGTNVERKGMREVAAPSGLSDDGMILGTNFYQGREEIIRLSDDDRRRHIYVIGQTGTGKSVFLENCIIQDIYAGKGVAFIDPHGDTAEKLMSKIPPERAEDVVYFNPGDANFPMGWNLMEFDPKHPEQKDFLVQEAISMLYKIYDPHRQGFMGPRFEAWFRNAALTVMADPEGGTFIEIPKVFIDDEYLKKKFKHVTDPVIQDFWTGEMAQTDQHSKSEMLGWFVSKFGAFANNEIMRNIVGQKKSAFDLREMMDDGKIVFINLSKGLLGDINSQLLGIIFIIKFQIAAMSRADVAESERRDFSLYIDEFQNYSTDSIATILSEARKYHLSMIMANQFISQLDEKIRDSVFGNVGSIISFRIGPDDAEFVVKQFAPSFSAPDLINTQNHYAAIKIISEGKPTVPFSMKEIMPPLGISKPEILAQMKELSRSKYAKPKAEVAEEIKKSLGI